MLKTKKLLSIFLLNLSVTLGYANDIVPIKDAIFKNYLLTNYTINTNNDGEIQVTEAKAFTGELRCGNLGITDLSGIEYFENITGLVCTRNSISQLDLSKNSKLQTVEATGIGLQSLVLGTHPNLKRLTVMQNKLTQIDLSKCPNLEYFVANMNELKSLDVQANPKLSFLWVRTNHLKTLNLTKNRVLRNLNCFENELTQLDVSNCSELEFLLMASNGVKQLNLTQNAKLRSFNGVSNPLESIDFSGNPKLESLHASYTKLKRLDLSANTVLTTVNLDDNSLEYLNLKNGTNKVLTSVKLKNNSLLKCIQVDDPAASLVNVNWEKDTDATYSTSCKTMSVNESSLSQAIVFPNPATNAVQVTLETDSVKELILYTTTGVQIKKVSRASLELGSISGGVYLLEIRTDTGRRSVQKLVVK